MGNMRKKGNNNAWESMYVQPYVLSLYYNQKFDVQKTASIRRNLLLTTG